MGKIYFVASDEKGKNDARLYAKLIEHLKRYGEVLTDRDIKGLSEAETIVAEITTPNTRVGYEVGRIAERNLWVVLSQRPLANITRILCLYRTRQNKRLNDMITSADGLTFSQYKTKEEAKKSIDDFFRIART